jgi:hypothetical protein
MASSRLSPDQFSRAGAGKPLFGSAMSFHFPFFHDSVIPSVNSIRADVLLRRHDHDQASPFHARGVLDRARLSQFCDDRIHERSAHLLIRHFTTAVRQEDFGLVTIG